jgi:hypothetical protein
MEIEEVRPNKPNFPLIVALSVVVIGIVFVIALLVLHLEGKHLLPHRPDKHPTSELRLPVGGAAGMQATAGRLGFTSRAVC